MRRRPSRPPIRCRRAIWAPAGRACRLGLPHPRCVALWIGGFVVLIIRHPSSTDKHSSSTTLHSSMLPVSTNQSWSMRHLGSNLPYIAPQSSSTQDAASRSSPDVRHPNCRPPPRMRRRCRRIDQIQLVHQESFVVEFDLFVVDAGLQPVAFVIPTVVCHQRFVVVLIVRFVNCVANAVVELLVVKPAPATTRTRLRYPKRAHGRAT